MALLGPKGLIGTYRKIHSYMSEPRWLVMVTWVCLYGKRPWAAWLLSYAWTPHTSRQLASPHYIMRMYCFFPPTGWKKNVQVAGGWHAHLRMGSTLSPPTATASNEACSSAVEVA